MPRYEYKIVLAPEKSQKFKGLRSPERFVATVEQVMNEMGSEGWQYLRADTLPQEERSGLTSKVSTPRNLLIFQREIEETPVQETSRPVFSKPLAEPPLTREDPASLEDIFAADPDAHAPDDPQVNR